MSRKPQADPDPLSDAYEYERCLSDAERDRYDELGQQGATHEQAMAYALGERRRSFRYGVYASPAFDFPAAGRVDGDERAASPGAPSARA